MSGNVQTEEIHGARGEFGVTTQSFIQGYRFMGNAIPARLHFGCPPEPSCSSSLVPLIQIAFPVDVSVRFKCFILFFMSEKFLQYMIDQGFSGGDVGGFHTVVDQLFAQYKTMIRLITASPLTISDSYFNMVCAHCKSKSSSWNPSVRVERIPHVFDRGNPCQTADNPVRSVIKRENRKKEDLMAVYLVQHGKVCQRRRTRPKDCLRPVGRKP